MPFEPGGVVKFPAATCAHCALRDALYHERLGPQRQHSS